MQNIHPLLDAEKQLQAQSYEKEKRLYGLLGSVISLVFVLWFYFSGLSQQIDKNKKLDVSTFFGVPK